MALNIKSYITDTSLYKGAANTVKNMAQAGLNIFPNMTCSTDRAVNFVNKTGEKVSSAEQRLILGASALLSQPFIDARNKKVDEETRKVSVARTIAKTIAGTFTGYFIRKGCIKGIDALSKVPGKGVPKWKTLFTPKGITNNATDAFKQYRNAMGTVVALVVMIFTNFLIDLPLTKFLTNLLLNKKTKKTEGKKCQ